MLVTLAEEVPDLQARFTASIFNDCSGEMAKDKQILLKSQDATFINRPGGYV
jgi:hypothetical protein